MEGRPRASRSVFHPLKPIYMILLRRLLKSKSLRVVNVAGLAVVFACMLLSYAYVA